MATALFVQFVRLFTFLEGEGVDPTNNIVERILRIAVQWLVVEESSQNTSHQPSGVSSTLPASIVARSRQSSAKA